MKRAVLSAVLTAGLAAGTLPIFAQTATDPQNQNSQQQGTKEGHWRHKRGDHMQNMAQKLNLTQQQQDQLKPIMEKGREQAKAIWQDNSLNKDQKREKLQALHQQTKAEVNGILTPQQQQQMASLREEGKQRMAGRHEKFGQKMAQKLNLTQQQQDQLKPMFEKQREEAKAIRQDNSLTSEQKKEKMQALRQQTQSQMNQVLTPEQQQQLQQMRENRKQHRNHGGGSDQEQGQQRQGT